MNQVSVGIDIGGTHIRSIAEVQNIRSEITRDRVADNWDELVNQIVELAKPHAPKTIGITLPGRIENNIPSWVPNLDFLDQRDLVRAINNQFPCQIKLINDAQAALLAEAREGAAAGLKNVALIAVGTGIGGAVMINGQIFTGHSGTAGSFGWMPAMNFDVTQVSSPINSGPWEQTASGTSLLELATKWQNVETLLKDFHAGDESANQVIVEFALRLGEGFAAIASVFDPELIVVGGGVSAMLDALAPKIKDVMSKVASPTGRKVSFRQAALGVDAGVVGALIAGIEG